MNKNNVVSFIASPKTQKMMTEELNWCMRDKTPQYAKWQAKDGDTVIDIEGVPLFVKDDIPEMKWFGLIDYKPKGLHKGFQWKFGRKAGQ